ncbi:hypothetical protein ACKWTF_000185 [Chironomus riparius]
MYKIILSSVFILTFLNVYDSVHIECNYGILGLWAVGNKYRCSVDNHLFVDSPEKAQIDDISGTHMNGKDNNDEIYFHIRSKAVQYLPRGLEKFFKNVTGIAVWYDLLKEIHQFDFKPFKSLECVNIFESKIEIIEENIFDYNPNLIAVSFGKANIFHIGSTVFDHLSKLTSLHLGGNTCINEFKENNRAGVEQIIRNIKLNCISSEFLNFDKKLKILENSENLKVDLNNFENEFRTSKFASCLQLNLRLLKIKDHTNDEMTTTDKPKIESTSRVILNCSERQNWTETYQNQSIIDDLQIKNFENLKYLRNLTEDIKASQFRLFTACNSQSMTDNNTFNEKLIRLEFKLTTFGEKFKKLEENLKELNVKIDNSNIIEIEKKMIEKIGLIIEEKFEKLLKALKVNSELDSIEF